MGAYHGKAGFDKFKDDYKGTEHNRAKRGLADLITAKRGSQFIKARESDDAQPWMMTLALRSPHTPLVPAKRYENADVPATMAPGAEVRLRYAFIVKCTGVDKDAAGNVTAVHCTYDPETRSGTPGADTRKVKGNIHWLSAAHAVPAEVRLYDHLFSRPDPGAGGDLLADPAIGVHHWTSHDRVMRLAATVEMVAGLRHQ